jgi:hypothetical protein
MSELHESRLPKLPFACLLNISEHRPTPPGSYDWLNDLCWQFSTQLNSIEDASIIFLKG